MQYAYPSFDVFGALDRHANAGELRIPVVVIGKPSLTRRVDGFRHLLRAYRHRAATPRALHSSCCMLSHSHVRQLAWVDSVRPTLGRFRAAYDQRKETGMSLKQNADALLRRATDAGDVPGVVAMAT